MTKKFWIFNAGKHVELRETIAGFPQKAKHSRGVRDSARGPNAVKILVASILEVSRKLSDSLEISFKPHPQLEEERPNFYSQLTPAQEKQAREALGPGWVSFE